MTIEVKILSEAAMQATASRIHVTMVIQGPRSLVVIDTPSDAMLTLKTEYEETVDVGACRGKQVDDTCKPPRPPAIKYDEFASNK